MRSLFALLVLLAGSAAVLYGLWSAWPPLAWIVTGLAAMRLALLVDGGDR